MTQIREYNDPEYSIRLELLEYSYWEHFKMAKDLEKMLPLDHPKRIKIENELNKIALEMAELEKKQKSK